MKSLVYRLALPLLLLTVWAGPTRAQVKYPKPPDAYDIDIRYRIVAERNERLRQYDALLAYLEKLGFREAENEESDLSPFNPEAERLRGTIPSARVREVLRDPRVQTVIVRPAGYKDPENPDEPVKVQIDLSSGLSREEERLLNRQSAAVLARLGFREATGYDHLGFTRLRGTLPANSLQYVIKDLRRQPQGWFVPETPAELLPEPFASVLPVRFVEVTPEPEGAPPAVPFVPNPKVEALPGVAAKLGPALKELLSRPEPGGPARLEVVLAFEPERNDDAWRRDFERAIPDVRIEGRMGTIATVTVQRTADALNLAGLPVVEALFLPRMPTPSPMEFAAPPEKGKNGGAATAPAPDLKADALKLTRLDRLHALNFRGGGIRVVLVDSDFSGYERFVGRQLPKATRLIDMTAERSPSVVPDPQPAPPGSIGHGTHCALAAALAAPQADFTLVRVDPAASHQVYEVARYVRGEPFQPESIRTLRGEIEAEITQLNRQRVDVAERYRRAFESFEDDEPARKARRDAQAAVEALSRAEQSLLERTDRLNRLEAALIALKGARVVSCPFVWQSGHPLEANGGLSRYLDENYILPRPPVVENASKWAKPALWFQAASDTRGQIWADRFRDDDHNGVMEFVPFGSPLPVGRWTPELNFLAFEPAGRATRAEDLPASARIRVTMQWREPHDPALTEDYYREPITPVRLMLLRQRDPSGVALPTDEMDVISVSAGSPVRLTYRPDYGIYEQAIELTLPAAGRYALRVEGRVPQTFRPEGLGTLPALERQWTLRPRLFLDLIGGPARGRVVFWDFPSSAGGIGMAAESRAALTVGAATLANEAEAFSAVGAGPAAELLVKPDVWSYDRLRLATGGPAKGTALAGSFAAGTGAALLSAGASQEFFLESLGITPGQILQIPSGWLQILAPKK